MSRDRVLFGATAITLAAATTLLIVAAITIIAGLKEALS